MDQAGQPGAPQHDSRKPSGPGLGQVLLGALIGAVVGLGVTAALTLGSVALSDGDTYELLDPVLVMGAPVTLIGATLGATFAAWPRRPR